MLSAHYIPEPLLEFAHGQKLEHPQDGLFLYGPVNLAGSPGVLRVGVIGAPEGIDLVKGWLVKLAGFLPVKDSSKLHTSPWPGFQAAFGARLPLDPLVIITLSRSALDNAARKSNRTERFARPSRSTRTPSVSINARRKPARMSGWS
jgi:hypothetical protein